MKGEFELAHCASVFFGPFIKICGASCLLGPYHTIFSFYLEHLISVIMLTLFIAQKEVGRIRMKIMVYLPQFQTI